MGLPNWTRSTHVFDGGLDRRISDTKPLSGHADAAAVQSLHGNPEPVALLADEISAGDPAVFKDELGNVSTADAKLLFPLANGEAGVPRSTTMADIPLVPFSGSVRAITTT